MGYGKKMRIEMKIEEFSKGNSHNHPVLIQKFAGRRSKVMPLLLRWLSDKKLMKPYDIPMNPGLAMRIFKADIGEVIDIPLTKEKIRKVFLTEIRLKPKEEEKNGIH